MKENEIFDIVIVGGGPAGMSVMLYALRAKKKVVLLEKMSLGGQIVNSFELANYPALKVSSGQEFVNNLKSQISDLSGSIVYERVESIIVKDNEFIVTTTKTQFNSKTVVIAVGSKDKMLNIPGEKKFLGKGVSYCAVCDGIFFKNEDVAIIGGGNTAVEYARYMQTIANKIYLVNIDKNLKVEQCQLDAIKTLQKQGKIVYCGNCLTQSINGENAVESITIKDIETNQIFDIKVNGVFVAIGKVGANMFFDGQLKVNADGYVITDENMSTNINGLFACGDVRKKSLRQVITACSDGAIAVNSIIEYLNKLH